jgi:transcription initiation factor TFIIIB Brf1 subunit/transcription initiation factor TFIIB
MADEQTLKESGGNTGGESCQHLNRINDDYECNIVYCADCGQQLTLEEFSQEAEYHFGDSRTKTIRCHRVRCAEKTIDDVFTELNLNIPQALKDRTNEKFQQTLVYEKEINNKSSLVSRSASRKSLAAGCIWHVYYEQDDPRTTSELSEMFGINKTLVEKGKSRYEQAFPGDRRRRISAHMLLKRMMQKSGIDPQYYTEIADAEQQFRGTTQALIRSNVDSVAAAFIYDWLKNHKEYMDSLGLTDKTYSEKVKFSEITIKKLGQQINEVRVKYTEKQKKLGDGVETV